MPEVLRIGTRGSPLALRQAEMVRDLLLRRGARCRLEVVPVRARGGVEGEAGAPAGKERFVAALRRSLLEGEVDLAVHSLKDVPLQFPPGISLVAFPACDDPREAFVSLKHRSLLELPPGGMVGTSSPRRVLQLALLRPDLQAVPLRGNVDTRLRKLEEGECDALILALAGLRRLGREGEVREVLPPDVFVPAPGQGIIAVEAREDDRRVVEMLSAVDDAEARTRAHAERSFCAALGADCDTATGVVAVRRGETLEMTAIHRFESSGRAVRGRIEGSPRHPEELGRALARRIVDSHRRGEVAR